jgi:polyhydroxybutyrate depolymerase
LIAIVVLLASLVACANRRRDAAQDRASTPATTTAPTETDARTARARTVELAAATDPVGTVRTGAIATSDGRNRSYRVYVPSTLPADRSVPLLVGLHGGTGWGEQFEDNSQFDSLAEANNIIVVYPDGIGAGLNPDKVGGSALRTWNGGLCCGAAVREQVDDVGFISALLDRVIDDFDIDPNQVFVTGHSNGAIMALRLACELAPRIAAVGVVAGVLGVPACNPNVPVSVMQVHGAADANIPLDGGVGPDSVAGVAFPPPRVAAETFARLNTCPTPPITSTAPDNAEVTTTLWTSCAGGAEVQFITIDGAHHAWPGSAPKRLWSPGGDPYENFDASAEVLTFLLAHPRQP